MNQTLTADQLAAQFLRSAVEVEDAVDKVVKAAAYSVRGHAYDAVSSDGGNDDNDPHRYAARLIDADPDGPLEMVVGYDNSIEPLAAGIEFGSTTIAPGAHLARALKTEAPIFAKTVVLAALKRLRNT